MLLDCVYTATENVFTCTYEYHLYMCSYTILVCMCICMYSTCGHVLNFDKSRSMYVFIKIT